MSLPTQPTAPRIHPAKTGLPEVLNIDERVIQKVSRRLLGFLLLLFVVSFLGRINIGFAGLTMMKDLGLSSLQFGLATTLFYAAYIACGVPSNIALARLGARRWIGSIMIAWGLASAGTMFATSAESLYSWRVLVGITEAGFLPGTLLYLTYWFPAAYRARANAIFMSAMPVTAGVGSDISGLILGMGWLKDVTQSFTTGLIYASVLLVVGCVIALILPIPKSSRPAQSAKAARRASSAA